MHFLILAGLFAAGVIVGVLGHVFIAKEEAATKADLSIWAQRLRSAFDSDVTTAKVRVQSLIKEIEEKL